MITIRQSQFHQDKLHAEVSARVEHARTQVVLRYSVEPPWAPYLNTERQDSFVLALLPSAMQMRADLRVEGVMSERLFYNLSHHYMALISSLFPQLKPVRIIVDQLDRTPARRAGPGGVVTGFSGGIDSFFVFAEHFFGDPPASYKITHALNNNVGAHGWDDDGGGLFRARYDRFRPLMEEWGLPFLAIDTNLPAVLSESGGPFPQPNLTRTHTTRNVSCVLMLDKLFSRYLYASSFPFESCRLHAARDTGYGDPATVHLLSTEGTECVSTGGQYDRVRKTEGVVTMPESYRYLDVCCRRRSGRNCSYCKKCLRTLMTLEVLGQLEQYEGVFNLDIYRYLRGRHLIKSWASPDVFMKEVIRAAQARGFQLPPHYRMASVLHLWRLWPNNKAIRKAAAAARPVS